MQGIANRGIEGDGFGNLGEGISDRDLLAELAFAPHFHGELLRLLVDRKGWEVGSLCEKSGEVEYENSLSPGREISAMQRGCDEESSEMGKFVAVVNLKRFAEMKMSN